MNVDIYRYVYYTLSIITLLIANNIIDRKPHISRILRLIVFASSVSLLLIPGLGFDLVSSILLLLSILGSLTITLHSEGYLKILFGKVSPLHLIIDLSLLLFIVFLTTRKLIEFIITWIIVELASTLLIMLERGYRNFNVVTKYLIVCVTAGDISLFILLAISITHLGFEKAMAIDLFELTQISNQIDSLTTFLLVIGFTAKLALIPLHFWLIDTYVNTPSPGTAIFSGLLSKMSVYALIRIFQLLNIDYAVYSTLLLTQGVLTTIYGFFSTALHSDIKKVMSYSSMGYCGVFAILLSLLPVNRELFLKILLAYILYHGLIKIHLFLNISSIELLTNTRDIYRLGYLAQISPRIYDYSIIAFLTLIGIPPTIGFLAKYTFFTTIFTLLNNHPLKTVLLLITMGLASVFTIIYSVKYLSIYTSMFKSKPMRTAIELLDVQYCSEYLSSILVIIITPLAIFLILDYFAVLINIIAYLIGIIVLVSTIWLKNRFIKKEKEIWLGGIEF
ncbi:MAG: proton-conducting transporter membrane subunit [Desulfurococcaceae archaeon]